MKPAEIYTRTVALGLSLQGDGDRLLVFGNASEDLPPELVSELRQHKRELLALLEGREFGLPLDEAAWLHTATQILAGEFDGADRSTIESLVYGLQRIEHPLCKRALERLGAKQL